LITVRIYAQLSGELAKMSLLKTLSVELAECDTLERTCLTKEAEHLESVLEQHWALRARINQIPARTLEDLKAKVSAADLALRLDEAAECDAEGSFVDLCKSINRDIAAMAI
jgi:hypothetical protein